MLNNSITSRIEAIAIYRSLSETSVDTCSCVIGCQFCWEGAVHTPVQYVIGNGIIRHIFPIELKEALRSTEVWVEVMKARAEDDA